MENMKKKGGKCCCVIGWKIIVFFCLFGIFFVVISVIFYEIKVIDCYI